MKSLIIVVAMFVASATAHAAGSNPDSASPVALSEPCSTPPCAAACETPACEEITAARPDDRTGPWSSKEAARPCESVPCVV